jgi:hypothetical protein
LRRPEELFAIAAALCALVPGAMAHADLDYRLKVAAISEVDTNADRREGETGRTDGATRVLVRGSLAHRPDAQNLIYLRLDVGTKMFFHASEDDLFVTSASVAFQHRFSDHVSLVIDGLVKDRRERVSETDYFLGQGGGALLFRLSRELSLRARVGYGGFVFKPDDFDFGYQGDDYLLELTARPSPRLRLSASYDFARRAYRSNVLLEVLTPDSAQTFPGRDLRDDFVHTVDLRVRYVRGVLVEGGYMLQAVTSNSFGFSYLRHQISAQLSAKLPGAIFFHVAGALQFLSFSDPVFLERTLFIEDDNRNWVSVKLSREIGKGFAIEARYNFYTSTFAADVLYYRRHVVGIGVAYSL